MSGAIKRLVEKHQSASTQREKAAIEQRIWDLASPSARRRYYRRQGGRVLTGGAQRTMLRELLGVSTAEVANRGALRNAGAVADPLWQRVEDGSMPLATAVRLLREARRRAADESAPMTFALRDALKEYDALPLVQLPGGTTMRRHTPGRHTLKESQQAKRGKAGVWMQIRRLLGEYLAQRLGRLDEERAAVLWRELENELRIVADQMVSRIEAARRQAKELASTPIGMGEVALACALLSMDEPEPGGAIDLARARKQLRRIVRPLHADRAGEDYSRERYQEVLEAYKTLERYNEQLGRPKLTVIKGGTATGTEGGKDGNNHES